MEPDDSDVSVEGETDLKRMRWKRDTVYSYRMRRLMKKKRG